MIEENKVEVKLSNKGKPINPNNPNQSEDQGGRPGILPWSNEVVIKELEDMLKTLKKDKTIIYIGELFLEKDYSRSSFIQQVTLRKSNEELVKLYNTIKEILETRAVKGLLGNGLNSTGTIFHLKNNYGWVDKQVNENTNTNLNLEVEDSEELKDLLNDNGLI